MLSHVYPDGAERPVAYASRTLSKTECGYPQLEKEALSLVRIWGEKVPSIHLREKFHAGYRPQTTDHNPQSEEETARSWFAMVTQQDPRKCCNQNLTFACLEIFFCRIQHFLLIARSQ